MMIRRYAQAIVPMLQRSRGAIYERTSRLSDVSLVPRAVLVRVKSATAGTSVKVTVISFSPQLQWGRGLETAEIVVDKMHKVIATRPSMGPRSSDRGKGLVPGDQGRNRRSSTEPRRPSS